MGGNEYSKLRVAKWLFEGWDSDALVTIIKEDKMEQENLEFVREVLDDTLVSGVVNSDRVLAALEIVADLLQDGETNDDEVQSIGSGANTDGETFAAPVQEDGPDSGSDSAEG